MKIGPGFVVAGFLLVLAALVFAFGSWGTVEPGHVGVVIRMGAVSGTIKQEGFYTKTPLIDSVVEMDTRIQKEQVPSEGASRDLQRVRTVVALNLNLDKESCDELYKTVGVEYLDRLVGPALQESVKAVIAQYTAEELITKREVVRQEIFNMISGKMKPYGIHAESLNIVDFDFSPAFNEAIEAKVTAEQKALASKNLLVQKEFEAKQLVATAKGKAEAMQVESAAIQNNPAIMQLRALEKWDGVLPRVSSGVVPFIDVGAMANGKLRD